MSKLALVLCLVAAASAAPQSRSPLPQLDGRIIGGEAVFIEDYNYQGSLLYYGSHNCGLSIISPLYGITAAHCTDEASVSALTVRVGSSFRNSGGVIVALEAYHQHPSYDYWYIDYDISILHFASELSFGSSINTIPLPALNQEIAAGTQAVVTGWGSTVEGGSLPLQLQAVEVPIVSQDDCKAAYGSAAVTDRMICAGLLEEGGKDACQGDSGGPLVADGVVVGIVSWGYGCARPSNPGVYGSVPNLRDYITEVTGL